MEPKIGVLGLNPHAGEHGLFGAEEEAVIIPAINAARAKGFDVEGPIPPDTAFLPNKRKETDLFVCMYHDQGHIPLKALCFDEAVNTTVVQKDAVVDAVEAAEVELIKKIGESGQPMIHSTTDRRGYTRKTNITGVCLDMFDRIRKNRNQKNNMG